MSTTTQNPDLPSGIAQPQEVGMPDNDFGRDIKTVTEEQGAILDQFSKEGDRTAAILAVCLLDNQIENILKAFYVKDSGVKSLFKDDHLLQTFNSKVNVAYFSGLIPKPFYHDLKLIGEIRNKLSHALVADLRFNEPSIAQKIRRFEVGRLPIDELSAPRSRFLFVVAQIVGTMRIIEQILYVDKPTYLVDRCGMNRPLDELLLDETQVRALLKKR
jgi:DNA-binding MltR family transcriptional regulator